MFSSVDDGELDFMVSVSAKQFGGKGNTFESISLVERNYCLKSGGAAAVHRPKGLTVFLAQPKELKVPQGWVHHCQMIPRANGLSVRRTCSVGI